MSRKPDAVIAQYEFLSGTLKFMSPPACYSGPPGLRVVLVNTCGAGPDYQASFAATPHALREIGQMFIRQADRLEFGSD